MATKRSSPKKRGEKAKGKNGVGKGKRSGNVELGPIVVRKIRVPINESVYKRKESELAQLEVVIAKKKRSIMPTQNEIRGLRKQVAGLTADIENNTEERDEKVREEFHFNTNELRILRASDNKLIEKRTMTAEERKRNLDIEDVTPVSPLTPAEEKALGEDAQAEGGGDDPSWGDGPKE
jgi:chromosome segregation ATPase